MEIKRFNSSASDLVSRWDSIGTIKRPERNTEMLIQSTESLCTVFSTVNEKVTKERQQGKRPSSKYIKWLLKAAETQTQVHEMLKSKGQNPNLLRHSRMYVRTIHSFINKIHNLLERSPYGSAGSVAYVALGISKSITSPTVFTGEAYGQILEMQHDICLPTPAIPSREALKKTSEEETTNAASQNEGDPTPTGDSYEQKHELQQDICLPTPVTPLRDALTKTNEANSANAASQKEGSPTPTGEAYGQTDEMQQEICVHTPATPLRDEIAEATEAQTMTAASQNEEGPTLLPGEAYGQIPEIKQEICVHTPATPLRDEMAETTEASQNEGGPKEHLLTTRVEKAREPTIKQAEGASHLQNKGGEAPVVEADASRKGKLETVNVAYFKEEGGQALHEAGISAAVSIKWTLRKILKCLNESRTRSIAIHGVGGIGKTTTLKELVNLVESMFDLIIWVTVSSDWSPRKIQNEVLIQLGLSLPDSEDNSLVADHIRRFLSSRKFLLILDDVWERVDLTALGIPDHSREKVGKIILASRILDVCKKMAGKRVFELKPWPIAEAWALFHKQVGELVESPEIQQYAKMIVRECGGLPLLIIATGRAMRGLNSVLAWKYALTKLELPRKLGESGNEAVMQRLQFSFDSVTSSEIKRCFLSCAFFPEDQEVKISELVRFCIAEGLVSGNSVYKRVHAMVDFLVDASLLQSTKGGLAIKMHDLMRELALRIHSEVIGSSNRKNEGSKSNALSIPVGYHFLLRAGAGLKEPPPLDKWEPVKVIALMDNDLSHLPETPSCPNLQKLYLQRNMNLRMIPVAFFECMPALEVLNLSNTRIKFLPQLISKLKGLKVLILRNCERLVDLPSEVGSLGALEVLDLHGTEINRLPDEIGRLSQLWHLDVSFYGSINPDEYDFLPPDLVSNGILSKLLSLKTLSIDVYPGDKRWIKSVESILNDIFKLDNLSALSFYFPEVKLLNDFLQNCPTWKDHLLTKFNFVVGYDVKRLVPRVPDYVTNNYDQQGRCLRFVNGGKGGDDVQVDMERLARTVAFHLDHHLSAESLFEFGVIYISGLKLCIVSECPEIESIIDGKDLNDEPIFPYLEYLSIHYSWNLKCIWKGRIPPTSFSKLRILMVHACPELKFVLTTSMLSCVPNLEELVVEDCSDVEAIILQVQGEITSLETDLAPSLKRLTLSTLPKLANISEGGWPSVEYINLLNCPNWKTISMNSHVQVRCAED